MARGNPDGSLRRAVLPSSFTCHQSLLALNHQLSAFNYFLASSKSVGGTRGDLDFYFCAELFYARHSAARGGKIRAAVAGGDRGIEKAAAFVRRTRRPARALGRRPAENLLAEAAQRVRGDFDDVNRPLIRADFR